ncbi:MAG: hypothetical protein AAFX99_28900, partial [Myxococcota bacterium]
VLDLAFEALDAGHDEEARVWAQRVVDVVEKCPEAHFILGQVMLAKGEGRQAEGHLKLAAVGRPDHPVLATSRPAIELMMGDPMKAVNMLRKHMDERPNDAHGLALLAEALHRARRLTRGRKEITERLGELDASPEQRRELGEVYYWLGLLHRSGKGEPEGGANLRKARELLGDRVDIISELAEYYRKRDNMAEAFKLYNMASDMEGAPVRAHYVLAHMAINLEKYDVAQKALKRYLATEPEHDDRRRWAERQQRRLERKR